MEARRPSDVERDLGVVALRLLSTSDRWVHRRVESISFQDSVVFQRRVSVDFSIDPELATPLTDDYGEPVYYVPLSLLRKRRLVGFSLRDESGRALPMPTRLENGAVAAALLIAAAERNVGAEMSEEHGSTPPDDVKDELWKIATEKDASKAVKIWEGLGRQDQGSATSRQWRERLNADQEFMALAYDFARNFLVMVPLNLEAGRRRVLKYTYEYRSNPPLLRLPRWLAAFRKGWYFLVGRGSATAAMKTGDEGRRHIGFKDWRRIFLGWFPQPVRIDAPALFQGGSYHLEIEAPEGLQITRGVLYGGPDGKALDSVRASVQRVHLYAGNIPRLANPKTATAVVDLRVRNQTFVRAAALIAAFSTVLLTSLIFFWDEVANTLSTAPSFLLLVPTALAAYVARSREPLATTERLFGVRLVAMSAGAWSFLGAVLLVVGRQCAGDATSATPCPSSCGCTSWGGTTYALIALAIMSLFTLTSLLRALTFGARPPEQKPPERGSADA